MKVEPGTAKDATKYTQRWRELFPIKYRAQTAVANGIRNGSIVRQPCETPGCGSTDNVVAHHDDYAEPLKIRWLCRYCHQGWHGSGSSYREGANAR